MKKQDDIICPICERSVTPEHQEKHHVIPKSLKGKETIRVCNGCGNMVHQVFTNRQLAKEYNTVDKLLEHPKIQKWVKWIGSKPNHFNVCMKKKKRKR